MSTARFAAGVALAVLQLSPPDVGAAVEPMDFADPFVARDGDTYVAFATGARGQHIQAARSSDLASWTSLPDALPSLPAWAARDGALTWAPSVLHGERWILFYTTRDAASGFQCISRATSSNAAGPYVDTSLAPLVCQTALCGSIDPSPYVDARGRPWLLWKSDENSAACRGMSRIWSQALTDDGLALLGTPTALLATDQPWERPLIEGPSMVREGERTFLFYSASWYDGPDYAVGYATCDGPSGPCTKKTHAAPLLKSSGAIAGPGGQEFFSDASGRRWMAYHAWTSPRAGYASGGARSLRIAPLTFEGGEPVVATSARGGAMRR